MKPPTYTTERFELRPYELADEDRMVEMCLDPISVQFMGGVNGIESEERESFQRIFQLYAKQDSKRWFWIWAVIVNGKVSAHFELKETEYTNEGELEIVYMVHPDSRKKGLMKAVLDFIKSEQKEWNRKIIATLDPENTGSLNLLNHWGISQRETLIDPDDGNEFLKAWLY